MPSSLSRPETSGTERSDYFFARTLRRLRSIAAWDSERFCDALEKWLR